MATAAEKAAAAKERARMKREANEANETEANEAEVEDVEAEGADEVEGDEVEGDGARRRKPEYLFEAVDELPSPAPPRPRRGGGGGGGGRISPFIKLFGQALENPGTWFKVAHYESGISAVQTLRGMIAGERQVPNGRWELAARKLINDADPDGERHSALYVKLHDADVDGVEFVNVSDLDKKWLSAYHARKAKKAQAGAETDTDTDTDD